MEQCNIVIGSRCLEFAKNADRVRIKRENRKSSFNSKEARKARREQQDMENSFLEAAEGLLCGPGIAD